MFNFILIFTSFCVQDDLRLPAKPGHPSIVTDTSNRSEYVEVDEASAKAFESYEVAR